MIKSYWLIIVLFCGASFGASLNASETNSPTKVKHFLKDIVRVLQSEKNERDVFEQLDDMLTEHAHLDLTTIGIGVGIYVIVGLSIALFCVYRDDASEESRRSGGCGRGRRLLIVPKEESSEDS